MATKKSAGKKTAGTATNETETPTKAAATKAAATKTAAKPTAVKTPAKSVNLKASAEPQIHGEPRAAKKHPSHHETALRAYLLWEQDGKKHGHQDHYWKQAEHELLSE